MSFKPIYQDYYPNGYERPVSAEELRRAAAIAKDYSFEANDFARGATNRGHIDSMARQYANSRAPRDISFAMRNAARDGLYEAYLAAQAGAPAMVGGAYVAAPIISGVRDYYDYQTMPRDEFYARKLGSMPKD